MKIIPNLETHLLRELQHATEINIAVALIKDYGLKLIEENVSATCNRRYLLGLDLPTPPKVLYRLLNIRKRGIPIESRIHEEVTYHPKVYIIKKNDDRYVAFIGSANATLGGLVGNREMNVMLTDQTECKELLSWFNNLFNESKDFNEERVKIYEYTYKKNAAFRATQRSNTNKALNKPTHALGGKISVLPKQFFTQSDFDAFASTNHYDKGRSSKLLRKNVWDKMRAFHNKIFPQFLEYSMTDLHAHPNKGFVTSLYYHSARNSKKIDAMWLHYGKSKPQLGKNSFTDACRLQVIIRNDIEAYVGIWLYIGSPNKSIIDRKNLKHKLSDEKNRLLFYEYFLELGDSYWIRLNSILESGIDTSTLGGFMDVILKDNYTDYFIIGRNYHPNDPDISEDNIEETVLVEFSKLHKLYQMITK